MTLEEAIIHAEEVAEEKENEGELLCQSESASIGCLICAEEHRQLAEWLRELKAYRDGIDKVLEQKDVLDKIRADIKALSPEPTAYDVVDGNPIKDAVWETLADVLQIIDKYKAESEDEYADSN